MADAVPQLRRCTLITEDDIRALAEFLRSPDKTEGQLQIRMGSADLCFVRRVLALLFRRIRKRPARAARYPDIG